MAFLIDWLIQFGYLALFGLLMLGIAGLPGPDEVLLLYAGYLASQGRLSLTWVIVSGVLGSMCGITVSYLLGRYAGLPAIHRFGRFVGITENHLAAVRRWYGRRGRWSLAFAYFVPGVRHLVAIIAGAAKLPWGQFMAFAYPGALAWVTVFILAGYFLGPETPRVADALRPYLFILALASVGVVVVLLLARRRRRRSRVDGGLGT